MKLRKTIDNAKRWFSTIPDRALDRAYRAALTIKAIEDEYFEGNKVCAEKSEQCDRVFSYCQAEVKKSIKTIKIRLAEFNLSSSLIQIPETSKTHRSDQGFDYNAEVKEAAAIIIEKLNFIDEVISKYERSQQLDRKISLSLVEVAQEPIENLDRQVTKSDSKKLVKTDKISLQKQTSEPENKKESFPRVVDKTGVLPRSILNTLGRIKREIDPNSKESEEEVVDKFRQARNRTVISIRFLLLLTIVPLLVHQLTKNFLVLPIVDRNLFATNEQIIFVNDNMQEDALLELQKFEETLHFKSLLGIAPELTPEDIERELKSRAAEIAEDYRHRGSDSISNIFADLCSLFAFGWVIFASKREILILKSFLDELIYGLSDSAKSFLIILFTDMFVGFHSPHGWEIILESISRHFGLPESRDFNFLFIATFPVILDTVLKYWIFRYLNRISPSAVATYKTMNE